MHIAKPLPPAGRPARRLTSCTTALLVPGVGAAYPATAADSVSCTFESPSQKLPFMALNGAGRVLVGTAPGGKSGQAARVNIPDDGGSFKSELFIKNLDAGSHRFNFANHLPGDWQQPDPLGAARLGHWNQWTFDITWSSADAPGSITVARDGVSVGTHQGANNYHRGQPPHFRIGAHRPGWSPERGRSIGPEHPRRSSSSTTPLPVPRRRRRTSLRSRAPTRPV
ncbi:polysaccharide lyase [Streptomyces avidinii]|uniref:heparin lyase I family protein n=1 Tax=Streptomyces avidinii TaxID=1895 RepID=UPI00386837D9|nr:polysaccharide lyase [Streptomyces avidinii]